MTQIIIEITSCKDCPHHKEKRIYTGDSWEQPYDWFCWKKEDKKIAGYVEWHDKVPIPDWCPVKLQKKMYQAKMLFSKPRNYE